MQRSRKLFLRSFLIGSGVSVFVFILSTMGFLKKWENGVFDFLMFWETEDKSSEIILIEINNEDYKNLFKSTSPLSRNILAETLTKLSMAKPKSIGLDISIESETNEDNYLVEVLQNMKLSKTPIIFPLPSKAFNVTSTPTSDVELSEMGAFSNIVPSENIFVGAINYIQPRDGVIREMSLLKHAERNTWPSFPLSIVAAGSKTSWEIFFNEINNGIQERNSGKTNLNRIRSLINDYYKSPEQKIHYIGDRSSFNTIQFSLVDKMSTEFFKPGTIFSDKIVLIGGTFDESRDFYMTPKGRLSGVEIIANSIETILRKNPIKPINHLFELLFEIAIIIVLSYFFFRFNSFKASTISFLLIIPLAIIGSILAFSNFNHWLNFIPVMASVIIHGKIASFEHTAKLHNEYKSLSKRLKEQEREILKLKRLARKKSTRKGKKR